MKIEALKQTFSVCELQDNSQFNLDYDLYFLGKTDQEISLVCPTSHVPENVIAREDGWRAFRIVGVLDFSLIGILSRIATLLAESQIEIFVISTFNTDYILTKEEQFDEALLVLAQAGYDVVATKSV